MKTKIILTVLTVVLPVLLSSCDNIKDIFGKENDPKEHVTGKTYPSEGLVAYYPFNGNFNDESGYLNDGTNYGVRLVDDRLGKESSAASFNGINNYMSVPHNSLFNFGQGDFSVFAVVKTGVIPEGSWNAIVSKHNTERRHDTEFFLYIDGKTGHPVFGLSTSSGVFERIYGKRSICDNDYHALCGIKENGRLMFYVDGMLIGSLRSTINPDNDNQINIGRSSYSSGYGYFNGVIDDVLIYERALTEDEIASMTF